MTTHNANLLVGLEYSFNIEIVAIHAKTKKKEVLS